ncbi:3624_t:CDS:2, partial [Scutellospora calospora]
MIHIARNTENLSEIREQIHTASNQSIYQIIIEEIEFALNKLNRNQGKDIESLWRKFYSLYCMIQSDSLTEDNINQFVQDAQKWVQEFARPTKKTLNKQITQEGLYQ